MEFATGHGEEKTGSRWICVDFRKVNAVTHQDAYPLPRIDATLDCLLGSSYFTTPDLASGDWQVEQEESNKEKTAFSTQCGNLNSMSCRLGSPMPWQHFSG